MIEAPVKEPRDLHGPEGVRVELVSRTFGTRRGDVKALDGMSLRVPTVTVSVVDFVANVRKEATKESINDAYKEAAAGPLNGILGVTEEPLVSMDFRGDPRSSIIDGLSTMVTGGNMVKVIAWYDNEWGYSCRCADLANFIAQKGF